MSVGQGGIGIERRASLGPRLLLRQLRPPLGGLVGLAPGGVEVGQIAHDSFRLLVLIAQRGLQDAVRLEQHRFRIVEPLQRRQRPSVLAEDRGGFCS